MALLVHETLTLAALLSLNRVLRVIDQMIKHAKKQMIKDEKNQMIKDMQKKQMIKDAKNEHRIKNLRWWAQLRAPSSKALSTCLENLGDRLGELRVEHVGDALCQNL